MRTSPHGDSLNASLADKVRVSQRSVETTEEKRYKARQVQVDKMLSDGWNISSIVKYFILADDLVGINAAVAKRKVLNATA